MLRSSICSFCRTSVFPTLVVKTLYLPTAGEGARKAELHNKDNIGFLSTYGNRDMVYAQLRQRKQLQQRMMLHFRKLFFTVSFVEHI